ncbi:TraR/DksA C4-type zinc finger protein [Pseudomonas frederiksbergensis]|uniref:TraR/DksA C4-type zinc finger protein n=1 Tax=Pseudomonas frederiksbergensis TaxID=104087 RepID=UPI0008FB0F79|nr:TraR/DksA C4-type zinc finger protein [Pseudomonas frederiksbergensis]
MRADDFATRMEAIHNKTALTAHMAQRETLIGPSAKFCQMADCEMPIPEDRRQAVEGVQFCAECQSRREKRACK